MADSNVQWWTNWNNTGTTSTYGPFFGGTAVQEAVYNTLGTWLPAYIAEMNRQLGGNILKDVTEYRHRPEFRTLPKSVECAILVIVPGTAQTPKTYQEFIRANWRVEVDVFIYGTKDWQETQALTNAYATAVRACLIQQRGLNGFAETTKWIGETYLEGEHSATRTTGLAKIDLEVTVGNNVTPYAGAPSEGHEALGVPTIPTLLPLAPYPTSQDVNISVARNNT